MVRKVSSGLSNAAYPVSHAVFMRRKCSTSQSDTEVIASHLRHPVTVVSFVLALTKEQRIDQSYLCITLRQWLIKYSVFLWTFNAIRRCTHRCSPVSYTHLDVYKRQDLAQHTQREHDEEALKGSKMAPLRSIVKT